MLLDGNWQMGQCRIAEATHAIVEAYKHLTIRIGQ